MKYVSRAKLLGRQASISDEIKSEIKGLEPYTGEWTDKQLFHLLRRSLYGLSERDIAFFSSKSMTDSIEIILTPTVYPAPPINAYNDEQITDPYVPYAETWVDTPFTGEDGVLDGKRADSLRAWWIEQMITQEQSIAEKMNLFWNQYACVDINLTYDARTSYPYLKVLRRNALGNFKTLIYQMTTCIGTLQYLSGNENTAAAPNENHARELQELFLIGKGDKETYDQEDVRAAARVLTGWTHDHTFVHTHFDPLLHDTNDKQFSAYYDNQVIKGRKGIQGGDELKDMIDLFFSKREVAVTLCERLYRWFVNSQITSEIASEIINPLADILIQNAFEIRPVLRALLSSSHFYQEAWIGCMIKNPVDYLIGLCRQLHLPYQPMDIKVSFNTCRVLLNEMRNMGLCLGSAPSVAGWPAHYIAPSYDKIWINCDTLVARLNAVDMLGPKSYQEMQSSDIPNFDFIAFTHHCARADEVEILIKFVNSRLSIAPFDQIQTRYMTEILTQGEEKSWFNLWNQYQSKSITVEAKCELINRINAFYQYVLHLPEMNLI